MKKIILIILSLLIAYINPLKINAFSNNDYTLLEDSSFSDIELEKHYKYYKEELIDIGYLSSAITNENISIDKDDYITINSTDCNVNNEDCTIIEDTSYTYYDYKDIQYIKIGYFNNVVAEFFHIYEIKILYDNIEIDYEVFSTYFDYDSRHYLLFDDDLTTGINFKDVGYVILKLDDESYNPNKLSIQISTDRNISTYKNYQIQTFDKDNNIITTTNVSEIDYPPINSSVIDLYTVVLKDNIIVTKDGFKEGFQSNEVLDKDDYFFIHTNTTYSYEYKLYKHYLVTKVYLDEYYSTINNLDDYYILDSNYYVYYYKNNNSSNSTTLLEKITNLEEEINSLTNTNSTYLDRINSLNNQVNSLTNTNLTHLNDISVLKNDINVLNNIINSYELDDDIVFDTNSYEELYDYLVLETNTKDSNSTIYYIYLIITLITIIVTIIYFKLKK